MALEINLIANCDVDMDKTLIGEYHIASYKTVNYYHLFDSFLAGIINGF
jgi:hypothetical protein